MGRKLDLSGLTDVEAEHVMQVVQRDIQLRKAEETRLNEMKKALIEEGSRSVLLSQQHRFNERCCIRCCSPFTFLLNPKRCCLDCCFNVCKRCCSYRKKDKGWLCCACQKTRLLKTQSLEWFYNNVKRRFKRFGSAKVLKNLYRRHAAEHGVLADLTEGSTYEESICNESSVYESDCTFYKQSEEHSMAETINVALRVAEEAIDEAISNAERQTDNQERQNEARYLRENRGELIEELATTIVQKIVRRKQDLSEMQAGCDEDQDPDGISLDQNPMAIDVSLWRSRSAFCLVTDEKTEQLSNSRSKLSASKLNALEMKTESVPMQAMPSWRSVDRLDNSMLQSPDGNWIAYQSNLLRRPSLLTKRKSLVYSVLEQESGVVSAYDEMGSETEPEANGVWGAALVELQRKMSATKLLTYPESYSRQATLPLNEKAQYFAAKAVDVDTEISSGQDGPLNCSQQSVLPFLKRKVPVEHRRASSTRRPNVMDVNFNPGEAESSEDGLEDSRVKRSRRRRKNKREEAEWRGLPGVSSAQPDSSCHLSDALVKKRYVRQDSGDTSDTATPDILSSGTTTPEPFSPDAYASNSTTHGDRSGLASLDQELTSKLKELASQVRKTRLTSTEDELDRLEFRMWDEDDETKAKVGKDRMMDEAVLKNPVRSTEKLKDGLTTRLIKLASQVSETQLSSTEDELDRVEDQSNTELINQTNQREKIGRDEDQNHLRPKRVQKDVLRTFAKTEAQNEIKTVETREVRSSDLTPCRFISEDGKMEFDRIVDTVVKALGDTEEHIEADNLKQMVLDQEIVEAEDQEMEKEHNRTEQNRIVKEESDGCSYCENLMEITKKETIEEGSFSVRAMVQSNIKDSEKIEQSDCVKTVQEKDISSQNHPEVENDLMHSAPCGQEYLSPDQIYKDPHMLDIEKNLHLISNMLQQKYSAASLRSITTEVLRVLNATEDLIHGSLGDEEKQNEPSNPLSIPPAEARRLDEQLCRLEENVYVAASAVYSLEAELGDLEECARSISGSSTERELTHLEEQLASAAAQVQQSELQVSDISSRIAALKNAGLDVTPKMKFIKVKAPKTKTQTIDSSRRLRRRLPAPPKQE